jgi:hypothetical protein
MSLGLKSLGFPPTKEINTVNIKAEKYYAEYLQ